MGYLVYHKESTRTLNDRLYKTHAAAQAAWTRFGNRSGKLLSDPTHPVYTYAVAEIGYFADHIEKKVERVNLMNGQTFYEPVNTPYHCSPASEAFWSA